jgi:hypothetical protein
MEGRETGRVGSGLDAWERLEMLWDDNVIGFNLTSQVSLLLTLRDAMLDAVRAVTRSAAGWQFPALLALGVASVLLLVRHRRGGRAPAMSRAREGLAFYARVQRLLARRGYPRGSGQTPLEVAERAAREGGDAGEAAVALTRAYYAARFGRQPPDPASVRALLARLEALSPRRR